MRLRLMGAVLLVVVGLGAAGYAVFGWAATPTVSTDYMTATAMVTDVLQEAVATGRVSASTTYGLGFGRGAAIVPPGASTSGASSAGPWNVTAVNVDVGAAVKQGAVLAITDGSGAQLALDSAQAALDAANAKLARDKAKPTAEDIAKAQTTVDQAQLVLDSAKQSQVDTAAKGKASVNGARQTLAQAQRQLSVDINTGASSSQVAGDRGDVTAASVDLQNAEAATTAANHQAQRAVDIATLGLQSAQQTYTLATAPATADTIASDEAAVALAQQALAKLQASGNGAEIIAPADGVITQLFVSVGGTAPTGDAVQMQAGPMLVTASFSEGDIGSLALGQTGAVGIVALGHQLTAHVARISVLPDSSASSPVVTYPVTLAIDSSPSQLRPGMTANVVVTVASANGVLAVPAIALQGTGKNYTVRVLDSDGSVNVVPVQVGLMTSSLVQIASGLSAGAVVIVGSGPR